MTAPRSSSSPRPHPSSTRTPAGPAATRPRRDGQARVRTAGRPARAPGGDSADGTKPAEAATTDPSRLRRSSRRSRLTGRAAILLIVLGMLAVAYAWPVRELVAQRQQIAQMRQDAAATQARIDSLRQTQANFTDPAFVQQQARLQLHFVMPGEVPYTVLRPAGTVPDRTLPKSTPIVQSWYQNLWTSVKGADRSAGTTAGR